MDVVSERTTIKVIQCCGDEEPVELITLVANSSEEYYALLRKLGLFASILQERDMRCPKCQEKML